VLILLATDDHSIGHGGIRLESILPDGKVGGFGRERFVAEERNYAGAVTLMTARVASVIAQDAGVTLKISPSWPHLVNDLRRVAGSRRWRHPHHLYRFSILRAILGAADPAARILVRIVMGHAVSNMAEVAADTAAGLWWFGGGGGGRIWWFWRGSTAAVERAQW